MYGRNELLLCASAAFIILYAAYKRKKQLQQRRKRKRRLQRLQCNVGNKRKNNSGLECSTTGEKVPDMQPEPFLLDKQTSSMLDDPSFDLQQIKTEFKTEDTSSEEAATTDESLPEIFDIQLVKSEIKSEFTSSEFTDDASSQMADETLFTTQVEKCEVKIEYTYLGETGFSD